MLNLDTHILIHALTGALRPAERRLLGASPWGISAIVLWELEMLFRLRRISEDPTRGAFAAALSEVAVLPITREVTRCLRDLDFKSDPADELIAATSLATGLPLVTRDRKLRGSKVVPVAR